LLGKPFGWVHGIGSWKNKDSGIILDLASHGTTDCGYWPQSIFTAPCFIMPESSYMNVK